jgi:hypothetical protein
LFLNNNVNLIKKDFLLLKINRILEKTNITIQIFHQEHLVVIPLIKKEKEVIFLVKNAHLMKNIEDPKDPGLLFLGIYRKKTEIGFVSLAIILIFNIGKNAIGVKKKKNKKNNPKIIRKTGNVTNAII